MDGSSVKMMHAAAAAAGEEEKDNERHQSKRMKMTTTTTDRPTSYDLARYPPHPRFTHSMDKEDVSFITPPVNSVEPTLDPTAACPGVRVQEDVVGTRREMRIPALPLSNVTTTAKKKWSNMLCPSELLLSSLSPLSSTVSSPLHNPPTPSSVTETTTKMTMTQNPLDLLCMVSSFVKSTVEEEECNERLRNQKNERKDLQIRYASVVEKMSGNWQQQREGEGILRHVEDDKVEEDDNDDKELSPYSSVSSSSSSSQPSLLNYPNGCSYSGQLVNGQRHGHGVCWYPNGCTYVGFWMAGKRHGIGRMTYADRGGVYEGEWHTDQWCGRGMYHRIDGRTDVAIYITHNEHVGEGVQWSSNREFAVRLIGGTSVGPLEVEEALEIGKRMGMLGVPPLRKVDPRTLLLHSSPLNR